MSAAIATIGHNNPPEPTPFELSTQEIDDLFSEAINWCDGEPIASEEQADAVTSLLDKINAAIKTADARRTAEKKPHDDAVKEIQARYNTLIGETKAVTGRAILAKQALQKPLTAWRTKVEDERRAKAEEARKQAEEAARKAQEALRSSDVDDLASRAEAETLIAVAAKAETEAKRADKAATTGLGLRTSYRAVLTDANAFLRWAWVNDREELIRYAEARAQALVNEKRRGMDGVEVITDKKAI